MDRDLSFSNLLAETAALIGDGIRPFLLYIVILGGLNALGVVMGLSDAGNTLQYGFFVDGNGGLTAALFQLLVLLVSVVGGYLLIAEFLKTRGRLAEGGPRILAYVGLSILMGLAVVLGIVLFIIPGIILMVRWAAATGFLVGGREGISDSFSASWHATAGHSWPIFFAGLVMLLGIIIVGGIAGASLGFSGSNIAGQIASALAQEAGSAVSSAFTVAVYVLAHKAHDDLGEVFG